MRRTLFKVLGGPDGLTPCFGGKGDWPPPPNWTKPVRGELIPGQNGYHLCFKNGLIHWIGPTIWIAECGKEYVISRDVPAVVARTARLITRVESWNKTVAVLYAAECIREAAKVAGYQPNDAVFSMISQIELVADEALTGSDSAIDVLESIQSDARKAMAKELINAKAMVVFGIERLAAAISNDLPWDDIYYAMGLAWPSNETSEMAKWRTDTLMSFLNLQGIK